MKKFALLLMLIIVCWSVREVKGQHQNQARGFQPEGVYSSKEIDNINLFNGNLTVTIPIGSSYHTSGGFSYSLTLIYNSRLWRTFEYCPAGVNLNNSLFGAWNDYKVYTTANGDVYYSVGEFDHLVLSDNAPYPRLGQNDTDHCVPVTVPNPDNNAGIGWSLSLGRLIAPGGHGELDSRLTDSNSYVYQASDGSEHRFYKRLHDTDPLEPGELPNDTDATNDFLSYTRDGSYLRMKKVSDTQRNIEFPNGTVHQFNRVGIEWRLVNISDQFGNFLNVSYFTHLNGNTTVMDRWVLTDSTGRTQTVNFQTLTGVTGTPYVSPSVVSSVVLAAFGGQTATYTFNYETPTIDRACPSGPATGYDRSLVAPFLTSVVLPDGSSFSMPLHGPQGPKGVEGSYDLAGSVSCKAVGVMGHVTLPTGGEMSWEYKSITVDPSGNRLGYAFPVGGGGRSYIRANIGVATRSVKDSTGSWKDWTYSPQLASVLGHPNSAEESADSRYTPREFTNTVTAPTGDVSVFYFSVYPVTLYASQPLPPRDPEGWDVAEYGLALTKDPSRRITDGFGRNLFLSEQVFRTARAGYPPVLMRSTYVRYETDVVPLNDGFGSMSDVNRRMVATETVYEDDDVNGGKAFTENIYSDFDGLGHFRNVQTVSNFGPSQSRSISTNYNPGRGRFVVNQAQNAIDGSSTYTVFPVCTDSSCPAWLLNTFDTVVTVEGGASEKKQYEFDSQGFPTKERIYRNRGTASTQPGLDARDILNVYARSPQGDLNSTRSYGGDRQGGLSTTSAMSVPTAPAEYEILNTYDRGILRTSQYTGTTFYSVNNSTSSNGSGIDANTGLIASSKDSSGVGADYLYDVMGRLTDIRPQQGGSWTHITYTRVGQTLPAISPGAGTPATMATADVDHQPFNGGVSLMAEEYQYDALGRLTVEKKRLPGGWSARTTTYNIMGWMTAVSELGSNASTTYDSFDPFGRPGRVRLPDRLAYPEADHTVYLSYNGIRKISRTVSIASVLSGSSVVEQPATTTQFYDMLGRISDVQEPSGIKDSAGNPALVTTSYSYDVGKHLRQVSTSASVSPAPGAAPTNYAFGATATASSIYNGPSGQFPPSGVTDGDRKGNSWGSGGGWSDNTPGAYPDWIKVDLAGSKTIGEIDVFTLRDNFTSTAPPNESQTFTSYGIVDFDVQYWNGAGWATVPGGHITGNNLVWRRIVFPSISTIAVRVVVYKGGNVAGDYSRIVEIEAWSPAPSSQPSQIIQNRSFAYDGRGFMTSETLPELGRTGNGRIVSGNFDTAGNVGFRNDGEHSLTYTYDVAGRLTSVNDQDSLGNYRPLKEYTYDSASGASGFVNGKLASATRHNRVLNPYVPGSTQEVDVTLTYTYGYGGVNGALSNRVLASSNGLNFAQSFAYNSLGLLSSQSYPTCTMNAPDTGCYLSGVSPARTIGYGYNQGLLTTVTRGASSSSGYYASSITYNQNSTLGSVVHSNGVTDTLTMDPQNIQRIGSISTSGVLSGFNWNSGTLKYDGAGNIKAIGSNWFLYDSVGRVVEGTTLDAANQKQTFTYDPFGNFSSVSNYTGVTPQQPNGPTGQPASTRVPSMVPATNRLDYSVYDGAGNLRGLVGKPLPFTYDAVNMIKYADPGKTFLYDVDDERVWEVDHFDPDPQHPDAVNYFDIFTLRGLGNEVLREYQISHARNSDGTLRNVWSWKKDYIYRGAGLLASEAPSERLHYTLDHLGTPRLVTDDARQRLEYHEYFPFGEEATAANGRDLLKFTGHERDFNYDGRYFDYMHGRFYGAGFGKFLSIDPALDVDTAHPQSWNLYSYAGNNPINRTDPDGRRVRIVEESPYIRNLFIQTIMRSAGRDLWREIARDPGFTVMLRDAGSTASGHLQGDTTPLKLTADGCAMTAASTPRVPYQPSAVVGALINIYSGNVAKTNPFDPTGLETFGHESWHLFTIYAGGSWQDLEGDHPPFVRLSNNGSAMFSIGAATQFGLSIQYQAPDISPEVAASILRLWDYQATHPNPSQSEADPGEVYLRTHTRDQ